MDEDLHEPVTPTRWLAWAVAALLTAGAVSAGAVNGGDGGADHRVVSAAGGATAGVEVPTTVSPPAAPIEPPLVPPPPRPSTTTAAVPQPTTTAKAPATTTTTKAPATTTSVKAPAGVTVSVRNEYPGQVVLAVNGRTFELAAGHTAGPVAIERYSHGNDIVEVKLAADPTCASGDADRYFPTAGSYVVTVVAGPSLCRADAPGPSVKVARA